MNVRKYHILRCKRILNFELRFRTLLCYNILISSQIFNLYLNKRRLMSNKRLYLVQLESSIDGQNFRSDINRRINVSDRSKVEAKKKGWDCIPKP